MNTKYGEKLKSAHALLAQAEKATPLLQEVLGPSADQVTAEWDLSGDGSGRPMVTLRIADWTGAVSTEFAPQELAQQSPLRIGLYHLWGQLLQARSEKQLQELLGTGGKRI